MVVPVDGRRLGALVLVSLGAALAAGDAAASNLIARNASDVRLVVNKKGEAMVTFRQKGKVRHVLAWGAVNAIPPARSRRQVEFRLDYSGGYGKYRRKRYWLTAPWACLPYDGPRLAWKVAACKGLDGSYWALQAWQRQLPNYGLRPTARQAVWELRLSHWTTPLPRLRIRLDWAWHRWHHLFGTFSYGGVRVYGFKATPQGYPLDGFGRNVFVDTLDSAYGRGWKRENSFLTHRGTGAFCYSFNPHGRRPAGTGRKYRATVVGPGVAPDVMWVGRAPGPYDRKADRAANRALAGLHDRICRPN